MILTRNLHCTYIFQGQDIFDVKQLENGTRQSYIYNG